MAKLHSSPALSLLAPAMLPVESKWLHPYPVANHGNHTNQERDPTPLLEEARAPSRQHSLPLSVAVPKAMMAVIVIQAL